RARRAFAGNRRARSCFRCEGAKLADMGAPPHILDARRRHASRVSTTDRSKPVTRGESETTNSDVAAFIEKVNALATPGEPGQHGRLLFALDATMSRQPTWDLACSLQAEMF